ncbi:MAG: ScpA family protein [Pseudomonadota bacterium]
MDPLPTPTPLPPPNPSPIARIHGQAFHNIPQDLYIPPDALEVFLESFEGPIDLLWYLIRKQNLDILDIPVAQVTAQYMAYVELMQVSRLELAAEYLVMAAMLTEIKSRFLLPRPATSEDREADPRADLVRRLQAYEQFKRAAEDLETLPRLGRDWFSCEVLVPDRQIRLIPPAVALEDILTAMRDLMKRVDLFHHHRVEREPMSVRERMVQVLDRLSHGHFLGLEGLLDIREGRAGVVVTFLALLELVKAGLMELVQTTPFGAIHVRTKVPQDNAG